MTEPIKSRTRQRSGRTNKVTTRPTPRTSQELQTIAPEGSETTEERERVSTPVGASVETIEEHVALIEEHGAPPVDSVTVQAVTKGAREATRKGIAYALILILATLVVVGCAGWLFWGNDTARMQNFSVLFGPVVTLLAGMLGFYFSSETTK